jgi:hypothetical protein
MYYVTCDIKSRTNVIAEIICLQCLDSFPTQGAISKWKLHRYYYCYFCLSVNTCDERVLIHKYYLNLEYCLYAATS